jgi:hypothetical protein
LRALRALLTWRALRAKSGTESPAQAGGLPHQEMCKGGKLYLAVLAAAGVILTYQLFIPPIVAGIADQGDFVRTIGRFGYGPQHHGSLEYVYVEPKFIPDPHYRSPYWEQANSEYLFVGAALALNKLVSKDGALDITVAGLVHALAFLALSRGCCG